ncbi:MAG: hypothetical protein IT443_13230 [Phycisphaeraceae bacterium]|nr:hypothetical protein [Phycisphaeraceae bacterium]
MACAWGSRNEPKIPFIPGYAIKGGLKVPEIWLIPMAIQGHQIIRKTRQKRHLSAF